MLNIDNNFKKYAIAIAKEFYTDFKLNFENIDDYKILELKDLSNNLLEEKSITSNKFVNYIKKMKRLIKEEKYKNYSIYEKYIIFMFSVDPSFEALKIYGECNRVNETKSKMNLYFGVYDSNLIKIEKEFIKKFLSQKEIDKINEEIDKRVFR